MVPRRPCRGHLDDAASDGPDVAGRAVALAAEHLGRCERDRALELAGVDARGLARQSRRGAEVPDPQMVAARVHEKVRTWKENNDGYG